jgi:hypothetical protein
MRLGRCLEFLATRVSSGDCLECSGYVAALKPKQVRSSPLRTALRFQRNTLPLRQSRKGCTAEALALTREVRQKGSQMLLVVF